MRRYAALRRAYRGLYGGIAADTVPTCARGRGACQREGARKPGNGYVALGDQGAGRGIKKVVTGSFFAMHTRGVSTGNKKIVTAAQRLARSPSLSTTRPMSE